MDRLRSSHPRLTTDATDPIGEARDEAQILAHVLLADQPHWHYAASRQRNRRAEEPLKHENSFGMVSQGAVAKIGGNCLGLIEPLVKRQKLLGASAPLLHRR